MGKKNKSNNKLGRALIKDRFGSSSSRRSKDPSLLHTAEVDDGYDWGRLNLQSVTEESSFQEFLSTAELAGTEFQAEKLNVTFVNPSSALGILSGQDLEKAKETQDKHRELLGIPRRPPWDSSTTADELQSAEREDFLEWRRRLARLQEVEGVLLTPYEKNLEFWRQLWRVVERSDIVVQIVDARNPLLFRCEDLEKYVMEISPHKCNLILVNKADFLTPSQRRSWANYFDSLNVQVAFYSATLASEEDDSDSDDSTENTTQENNSSTKEKMDGKRVEDCENVVSQYGCSEESSSAICDGLESHINKEHRISKSDLSEKDKIKDFLSGSGDGQESNKREKIAASDSKDSVTKGVLHKNDEIKVCNSSPVSNRDDLLSREELITLFKTFHTGEKVTIGLTTIGLVGYPNVGKSSTINSLLTYKKVSVSATPGKTKHFQTLYLERDLLLCDCPGLVMPSFVFTKAEMVVNGILPIDQMRDHVPPVILVASLIPRRELESVYGIMLPPPQEGRDPSNPPTAEELLNAYGYNRGFMTQNGQPDNSRAARYILKDFVKGKLLYCHAPPGCDQSQFHMFPERGKPRIGNVQKSRNITEELDVQFFQKASVGVHVKGATDPNLKKFVQVVGSLVIGLCFVIFMYTLRGMASSNTQRKRNVLTVETKLKILNHLEKLESTFSLACEYIKRNKDSVLQFAVKLDSDDGSKKRKTMRDANDSILELAVYTWFVQRRAKGDPISGPLLCEKALELNQKLGGSSDFKASTGWLKISNHGMEYGSCRLKGNLYPEMRFLQAVRNVNSSTKPWKDHRNKRNKREKLRRVYGHLDQ